MTRGKNCIQKRKKKEERHIKDEWEVNIQHTKRHGIEEKREKQE